MSEELTVPVTTGAEMDLARLRPRMLTEHAELKGVDGVTVTKIHMVDAEAAPRYHITFSADVPQWKSRAQLEQLGYDIGQTIGDQQLYFYASKRVEKSKGWSV